MTKREELDNFAARADEVVAGKYILADIKIVNLLKSIAASDTLVALFKNCLTDFDYNKAKTKYLVKNPLSDDKGEFVTPASSRELLAFIFNILMEIDNKSISFSAFLDKYFYEDGSAYEKYNAFANRMIKPFKNAVVGLMESVIDGKLQDPLDALTEEEEKRERLKAEQEKKEKAERELSQKIYGEGIKTVKEILLKDKKKIKNSKLKDSVKEELTLVVDMLANVMISEDKDAIDYAFVAYKYIAKAHPVLFFKEAKKVGKLVAEVKNEL